MFLIQKTANFGSQLKNLEIGNPYDTYPNNSTSADSIFMQLY